jgi:hypothetical protein
VYVARGIFAQKAVCVREKKESVWVHLRGGALLLQGTYFSVKSLYALVLGFLSTALVHRKFKPEDFGLPSWDACHAEKLRGETCLKIRQIDFCALVCVWRDLPRHG